MSNLFHASGLTKRFGRCTVVKQIDLQIRDGEIHALLGANGAGKSTLSRMIAGLLKPDGGQMTLGGAGYSPADKRGAEAAGVQIVQQELNLIGPLSVAENLFLSRLPSTKGLIHRRNLHEKARRALDRLSIHGLDPTTPIEQLGVGQQQMVEIAAALSRDCRLLILDEPTAALSSSESEVLFEHLGKLRDKGVGIVYISHRLDEVRRISNRMTILADGEVIRTCSADTLTSDQLVDMMGKGQATHQDRAAPASAPEPDLEERPFDAGDPQEAREPALAIKDLHGERFTGITLNVDQGEVVGLAGLVGSGRTELLRAVFGADTALSGTVQLARQSPARFRHPSEAVKAGIAMVTEDRKQNGLLIREPIIPNTSLVTLARRFSRCGILKRHQERREAQKTLDSLDTRYSDLHQSVASLSGGNQQKVVVAKWLMHDADVYLLDEPTRGIDANARRRLYQLIRELAKQGKGLLIASSDLEELMEVCDRIAVLSAGRISQTFSPDDWSEDAILRASFEHHRHSVTT